MFQADPRGILTLLAIAMCWALAVALYRVGPPGKARSNPGRSRIQDR